MIKGILALFTSGAILNPMLLLGIFTGIIFYLYLNADQIMAVYVDYRFYLLSALIAFIYNFLFKKVYQDGGYNLDLTTTFFNVIGSMLKIVIASALMISFLSMLSLA